MIFNHKSIMIKDGIESMNHAVVCCMDREFTMDNHEIKKPPMYNAITLGQSWILHPLKLSCMLEIE